MPPGPPGDSREPIVWVPNSDPSSHSQSQSQLRLSHSFQPLSHYNTTGDQNENLASTQAIVSPLEAAVVHAASALESLTQRDMNDNAELPNPILHSSTQTALTTSIHRNVTDGVHADAVEGDDSEGTRTSIPVSGPSNSSAIRRSPSGMNNTGHTNTSLVDTMSSLRRSQGIISSYLPSRSSPGVLARTHLPVSLSEQRIRETKRLAAFTSSPPETSSFIWITSGSGAVAPH